MEWFKKHKDAISIIGAIALGVYWMTNQVHSLEKRMLENFAELEKDVAIIKTVMIMKGEYPKELAKGNK